MRHEGWGRRFPYEEDENTIHVLKEPIMRPITLCLIATALLLTTGARSFAGEASGVKPDCQSTCATCQTHVASSTPMKAIGPKGGPIGKQIVNPYLGSQSAAYLAPTPGVINAGPIAGAKGQVRWPVRAIPQEQSHAAAVPGCENEVAGLKRGPKGGYLIPKGTSELQALQAIAAQCRIACQ